MVTKKKTTSKKSTKKPQMRSFVRATNTKPFLTFQFTHQTVYWLIIGLLVLGLGVWMTLLSMQVQRIYDQVELQNSVSRAQ